VNEHAYNPAPSLKTALIAMMGLQAIVAMALFAPGILAPRLGLSEADVSIFATGCFAIGMVSAAFAGSMIGRLGTMAVAACCMLAVILSMGLAALGSTIGLLAAGFALGLAFGPETPASSALLGRLAAPAQRPVVFSIRQTGNQIGAILASTTLPLLAVMNPRIGFGVIAIIAFCGLLAFLLFRKRYDPITRSAGQTLDFAASFRLMRDSASIRLLAVTSVPLSAMQLTLNAFLVLFLTGSLGMPHIKAGLLLAVAQSGGLIGRLGWGYVARYVGSTITLVAGLAFAMAACAITFSLCTANTPDHVVTGIVFVLGLTASGWNGIFLAEVAEQAPDGRMGEATGAVLTASYLGLVSGPVIVAGLTQVHSLGFAFATLGSACAIAGFLILVQRSGKLSS
jgi:MFS family permease